MVNIFFSFRVCIFFFFFHFVFVEDASSGYDSSDNSKLDSDTSRHSSPMKQPKCLTVSDTAPDILKVRSTYALSEDLKTIMTLPEMCDVTFLIGPSEVPVYGVRAILAMSSG